ncbi:E3 ubiquitin-protein ligase rnf213-alpha-like isoform X2 [Vanacampus margaritifer]
MAMMYPDFSEDTLPEKPIVNVVQCDDDTVLDTTALVLCCMQSPVGLLRDQQGRGCRSTQRLDTLLMLLSDGEQVTGDFLQTLKRRLYLMLASESNFSSATRDWVIKVASNMDALQDGGTFCSETRTILVRKYFAEGRDFTFSIPFSGSIKDYLEDLWVHALRNEGIGLNNTLCSGVFLHGLGVPCVPQGQLSPHAQLSSITCFPFLWWKPVLLLFLMAEICICSGRRLCKNQQLDGKLIEIEAEQKRRLRPPLVWLLPLSHKSLATVKVVCYIRPAG